MRNLTKNGLSMSQAQSISNLCNQRAQDIQRQLDSYNICSKTIKIDRDVYTLQEEIKMPSHILQLLKTKGDLHACQAFLMEAIKSKDAELERLRDMRADTSSIEAPQRKFAPDYDIVRTVEESWGWAQLSDSEYAEYLQVEAMAAHLGQFIHKNGKLSQMRKELANTPAIEFQVIEDGKKTPVKITKHNTSEELLKYHEAIAEEHRTYEQRVNYYKAKVKNLVSDENARIQKENADKAAEFLAIEKSLNEEYRMALDAYNGEVARFTMQFNSTRELRIKETAALRINVDPRFQFVIDMFITPEN